MQGKVIISLRMNYNKERRENNIEFSSTVSCKAKKKSILHIILLVLSDIRSFQGSFFHGPISAAPFFHHIKRITTYYWVKISLMLFSLLSISCLAPLCSVLGNSSCLFLWNLSSIWARWAHRDVTRPSLISAPVTHPPLSCFISLTWNPIHCSLESY